jgi:hypothetical protein
LRCCSAPSYSFDYLRALGELHAAAVVEDV